MARLKFVNWADIRMIFSRDATIFEARAGDNLRGKTWRKEEEEQNTNGKNKRRSWQLQTAPRFPQVEKSHGKINCFLEGGINGERQQ